MNEQQVIELIRKYNNESLSHDEKTKLETWYLWQISQSKSELNPEKENEILQLLKTNLPLKYHRSSTIFWTRIAAVASIVLCLGVAFYFYQKTNTSPTSYSDIAPGGNKAFLILADGKRIELTGAKTGEIADQSGVQITKTADGQVIYTIRNDSQNSTALKNAIETPIGGQYQISLPDGTRVWLNAASKLIYPVSFSGRWERKVELSGEAYFEVFKDKRHPFIVTTDKQEVEVLGTHFNVNSYADEGNTKTTLLEGTVRITLNSLSLKERSGFSQRRGSKRGDEVINSTAQNRSTILKPGQQAVLTRNIIKISQMDTEQAIAWKNGDFFFNGMKLEAIMRQIARWYNIEVSYQGNIKQVEFGGSISRMKNINEVLKVLETTQGVHFKIEGRRILVMP